MASKNQRRDASRRQLETTLRQRAVREQAKRRRTKIAAVVSAAVLVAVVVLVVAALNSGGTKHTATHGAGSCAFTPSGSASKPVQPPAATAPATGTVVVQVASSQGAMTFTMNRAKAPCTVASFASLAQQKYFDGTPCHRLTTSGIYVLQCGDPTGSGTGGPGYTIPDEYTGAEKYTRGVLAMANTGAANSGGSQFFIVYQDTQLPATYTVFGTVTSGLPVVDKVATAGSDNSNGTGDGKPKLPITLTTVTVR